MATLPAADILYHLSCGTIEMEGYVPWGSNYTFVCTVTHEDRPLQAVYKPRRGERPLWDFPPGTLCHRERAAYLISEALGWGLVPPTILRDGPHGWGSVQVFIDHDPNENYFTFKDKAAFERQLRQIVLFDLVINNADRKGGHVISDDDGRLWAIDHGIALHEEPKLRTVIWDFAGDDIPSESLREVKQFADDLQSEGELCRQLSELLSRREVDALSGRSAHLLRSRRYPQPGPGRPYPWPLV